MDILEERDVEQTVIERSPPVNPLLLTDRGLYELLLVHAHPQPCVCHSSSITHLLHSVSALQVPSHSAADTRNNEPDASPVSFQLGLGFKAFKSGTRVSQLLESFSFGLRSLHSTVSVPRSGLVSVMEPSLGDYRLECNPPE